MAIQTKDLWEQVRNKAWNKTRNRQKVRIAAQGCRTADSQDRRLAGFIDSQSCRSERYLPPASVAKYLYSKIEM